MTRSVQAGALATAMSLGAAGDLIATAHVTGTSVLLASTLALCYGLAALLLVRSLDQQ